MSNPRSNRRELLFDRFRQSQRDTGLPCEDGALLCPLCWTPKSAGEFTLEHIVPSAIGGTRTTLTCCTCNNKHGRDLDVHLVKYHEVHDALNGSGSIPSRLTVNGKDVAINLSATAEPKQISMHVVGQASRPLHLTGLQDDMHAGSADEFKIKMYLGYNPNRMQTALLRIGYQRVAEYNRHATHQDAIYVHKDEKPCSA